MLTNHVLEEINKVWEQQDDDDTSFLSEVVVCREIGKLLKEENFGFEFNPNTFNYLDGERYYNIPIRVGGIDGLIEFNFE